VPKAENYLEKLQGRRFSQDYIPPPDHKTLTIRGQLVGSLSNFVVYSGLPKTGKTTFISALLSSAIHPGDFFGMKLHLPDNRKRICYFDTESSEYDHYRTIERIKHFTTFNRLPDLFDSFILRQDGHTTIMRYIEEYLKAFPDCAVLVLDGLLDLILNYNSEEECRLLIQFIKRITAKFNILLITVLHLGKKDKETLGHLGSASDRYAQSTLIIEKDKDQQTYNLSPKFMRSDADFETVSIKNFQGVWHEVAYEAPVSEQIKRKSKNK
jgi:hypothetical protein